MAARSWIMTEGMAGTQNQCIALAVAANLSYEIKVIKLKQPWKSVSPWLRRFSPDALAEGSTPLQGPWPDIVIASGRKAIAPALWVKKQTGNKAKLVIVQSPVIKDSHFDLVIAPVHDRYRSDKTLAITGALSVITLEKLFEAKEEWRSRLEPLPGPRLAVLIGGNSRTHKMTPDVTERLAGQLKSLVKDYSLMITASRRTLEDQQRKLREILATPPLPDPLPLNRGEGNSANTPSPFKGEGEGRGEGESNPLKKIHFWDGTGDNPYRGYLAWADALVVSEDSVSMACEAVSTGKPVYIVKLQGGSARFRRFHDHLIARGYARWFEGTIDHWSYTPPDDLGMAVKRLTDLFGY